MHAFPVGESVGGCGARAVSRKTPIYFIIEENKFARIRRYFTSKIIIWSSSCSSINHVWKPKIDTSCCKLRKRIDLAEMQLKMLMLTSSLRSTVIGLLTSSSGVWNDGGECGGWQKGNRVADPARILPWIATSRKDKNNSQCSNCAGTAGGGVPSWEIHLLHNFSPLWLHRGYDIREAFIKKRKIFFFEKVL